MSFNYEEFSQRNIGFFTPEQQEVLKKSKIFIPGVGGMGGTALECLVRTGIQNFIIADIDTFEISNLNRQIFCDLSVIGKSKADSAKEQILRINPDANIEVLDGRWISQMPEILGRVDVVINGCDDHQSTITLMRSAKTAGKTVIDAFASTLPNVYTVTATDPRPEEFLGFPTTNNSLDNWSPDWQQQCVQRETEYVLTHSSTINHVVMKYALEMVTGKRKRISMAPMVWMTGILMAYEATKILLHQDGKASCHGVFLNPYKYRFEKAQPRNPFRLIKRLLIKSWLKRQGT
ncbi:MAG: ThiF family adenylyltransferase [Bdellovibrionota bacterium]